MIASFADKETQKIFGGEVSKKLPRDIQPRARESLALLNAIVKVPEDLWAFPSARIEAIGIGWSIRINNQWRITFLWNADLQQATEVRIVDYH